jgi:hypothetical protein
MFNILKPRIQHKVRQICTRLAFGTVLISATLLANSTLTTTTFASLALATTANLTPTPSPNPVNQTTTPEAPPKIKINEVSAHDEQDWIELYWLADDDWLQLYPEISSLEFTADCEGKTNFSDAQKCFKSQLTIGSLGDANNENNDESEDTETATNNETDLMPGTVTVLTDSSNKLAKSGDDLKLYLTAYLTQNGGVLPVTQLLDEVSYMDTNPGQTWARIPDGSGPLQQLTAVSKNRLNPTPTPGPNSNNSGSEAGGNQNSDNNGTDSTVTATKTAIDKLATQAAQPTLLYHGQPQAPSGTPAQAKSLSELQKMYQRLRQLFQTQPNLSLKPKPQLTGQELVYYQQRLSRKHLISVIIGGVIWMVLAYYLYDQT